MFPLPPIDLFKPTPTILRGFWWKDVHQKSSVFLNTEVRSYHESEEKEGEVREKFGEQKVLRAEESHNQWKEVEVLARGEDPWNLNIMNLYWNQFVPLS